MSDYLILGLEGVIVDDLDLARLGVTQEALVVLKEVSREYPHLRH